MTKQICGLSEIAGFLGISRSKLCMKYLDEMKQAGIVQRYRVGLSPKGVIRAWESDLKRWAAIKASKNETI